MEGPEFYDEEDVFDTYLKRRSRYDAPNDTLEKPILKELIGDVHGLRILDLGCGDAAIGAELLEAGAHSYLGIDGSRKMIELARRTLAGTRGRLLHADIRSSDYPTQSFDLVISRLALHYLADLDAVLGHIYTALKQRGRLVFSVEHPVITSCDRAWQSGERQDWIVDDYFTTGARTTQWMGGQVLKYHRTIEDYFAAVRSAGFEIECLRESRPQRTFFSEEATYLRRLRIPLFMFISARKPA